jgi:hypothetical protein
MFAEMAHEDAARSLEGALLDAINGSYWSDARSAIKGYAKQVIYPIYLKHCDQAYCTNLPNPEIKKIFEN